jgi:hypothetical protein
MKSITIEVPKGHKASFDEATNQVTFLPIPTDVKERILTFEDVLKEMKVDPKEFIKSLQNLTSDEVAYKRLKLIIAAFNEGWTPDWTNGQWDKFVAYFTIGGSSGVGFSCIGFGDWRSYSDVGSRLVFKSADLAKHVGKLFIDDFRDFLIINN